MRAVICMVTYKTNLPIMNLAYIIRIEIDI